MEKASTPRNRLTRSAAKQVNTPKNVDQDEDQILNEDMKQNVRKTRRKTDTKRKTNGDTSVSSPKPSINAVENKRLKSSEEVSDGNSIDGYDSDNSNFSEKQRNSPKVSNHNIHSPTISRKSLRVRRSITPGPELESSGPKKMKRSTSEGKLETLSTPISRRGMRAISESKDFKLKGNDFEKLSSVSESCSRYVHRNSTLRVIDKIVEANEGEDSSQDDEPLKNLIDTAELQKNIDKDKLFKENSDGILNSELKNCGSISTEVSVTKMLNEIKNTSIISSTSEKEEKVDKQENQDQDKTSSNPVENAFDMNLEEQVILKPASLETLKIDVKVDNEDKDTPMKETLCISDSFSEDTMKPIQETEKSFENTLNIVSKEQEIQKHTIIEISHIETKLVSEGKENSMEKNLSDNVSFSESTVEKPDNSIKSETMCTGNKINDIPEDENEKFDSDSVEIDIIAVDSNSQEVPLKPPMETKVCLNKSSISDNSMELSVVPQTGTFTENNNIAPIPVQLETDSLNNQSEDGKSNSHKVSRSLTPMKDVEIEEQHISIVCDNNTHRTDNDNSSVIGNFKSTSPENKEAKKNEDVKSESDITLNVNIDKEESMEKETEIPKEYEKEHNLNPIELEQCSDLVLIEESEDSPMDENSDNQVCYEVEEIDESEPCNIEIKNPHTVDVTDDIEIIQSNDSENSEEDTQNLMRQQQSVIDEINETAEAIMEVFEKEELAEENENLNIIKSNDQYKTSVQECSVKSPKNNEYQIHDDNEDKTSNYDENRSDNRDGRYYDNNEGKKKENYNENANSNQDDRSYIGETNYDDETNHEEDGSCNGESNYYDNRNHDDENYEEDNFKEGEKDEGENNFNEHNYDEGTSNKIEDSASDSDIYKDMSDFGTDGDEQKDGSQFNESVSSEIQSGESEEYISSVEEEAVEEEDENNENQECSNSDKKIKQCDQIDNVLDGVKDGEKLFDNDNPITYDKALAILNKNRVKKIDDEEFFDMFTQELNRVSEQSGSDSDIAIVDEYIMEPEETTSKPNKKPGNQLGNSKPIQRPPNPMVNQGNYDKPPPEHFYNQEGPPQHHIPNMQRMNFPNPNYQHYNQTMPIRGPSMYNQFPPPNQPMPDQRMFNSQIPPHANYPSGMLLLRSPNAPPLKVRSVNMMNRLQPFNELHRNYAGLQPETSVLEANTPREHVENSENVRSAATMTEADENLGKTSPVSTPRNLSKKSISTPILNLLGLDKQKLKQLKEVLGIDRKSSFQKSSLKTNESVQSLLKPRRDQSERKKRKRHRVKKPLKHTEKALKKSLVKLIIDSDSATFTDTRLKRPSHLQTSDETSTSSDQGVYQFTSRKDKESSSSSSESAVDRTETTNRKINVEDGKVMSVTLHDTRKPRYRKKRNQNKTFYDTSPIILVKRKNYNPMISSDSSTKVSAGKKMTQKKENKKKPTLVKSNCGTFTVDGVTASSQSSDSEVVSQEEESSVPSSEDYYLQELKKVRQDLKSGKNKLSNMFSQHNMAKGSRGVRGSGNETVTKKRKRSGVKKLPTEILENLSSEEDVSTKRQRSSDSGSEEVFTVPLKKRKRTRRRVKVRSSVSGESYVPCVTAGATQFGLSRLDKTAAHTLKAAQFRTDQLYGSAVKRITIMDFKG